MQIPKPIIFIIDDNENVCQALDWLLKSTLGLQTAIYHDARIFLKDYRADWYGCLLIDILMPGMNGLQLVEELQKRNNQMPIIIVTGHGDIPMAVKVMQAGVKDFITKPFNSQELLGKINHILADYSKQYAAKQQYLTLFSTLTAREQEIMKMIVLGKLNKQIATELGITTKTVELHRFNIMHKLQVRTAAELVNLYHRLEQVPAE